MNILPDGFYCDDVDRIERANEILADIDRIGILSTTFFSSMNGLPWSYFALFARSHPGGDPWCVEHQTLDVRLKRSKMIRLDRFNRQPLPVFEGGHPAFY